MSLLSIIIISIGLSADAFAVSVTNGIIIHDIELKHVFKIAISFGLFQAIMPIIGWAAGLTFSNYIVNYDHWIAFGLLSFIGIKMIIESRSMDPSCSTLNCMHFPTLILLSIATSIDALAVGLSFAMLGTSIITPVIFIGVITFINCFAGVYIGDKIGHIFENKVELIGGLILIAIGIKILFDHLT